jgi:hypothetical protein
LISREGRRAALKPAEAQRRIAKLMDLGEPFEQLETAIERLDCPEDEKAALWLIAWITQERLVSERIAREALA